MLARAAELQGIDTGGDETDAIGEEKLLEIAKEAGLDPTSVRQALAEERTRITTGDETSPWLSQVTGPTMVTASRAIVGEPEGILIALDSWMRREESLQVQRRFADRVVWEPRNDLRAAIIRALRVGGRPYQLSHARQVAATVVPLDDTRSMVRLDADLSHAHSNFVRAGAGVGAGSVVVGGSVATVGVLAHLAIGLAIVSGAVPVAVGGSVAYLILRRHRRFAERVALALEQMLDRLEYGDMRRPMSILDAFTSPRALPR